MANVYVYSGAAGAGTGADWANAYTTLAAAAAAKAAGDDFWVAHDHAEAGAGAKTVTFPGTSASPNRCICVNRGGSVPPVAADITTGASLTTTSTSNIQIAGSAYIEGLTFNTGTGVSTTNLIFGGANNILVVANCALNLITTGTSARISVSSSTSSFVELLNCTVSFGATAQGITSSGPFTIRNTPSSTFVTGATIPTALLPSNSGNIVGPIIFDGLDLSAFGSGNTLVADRSSLVSIVNCKLGASVTVAATPAFATSRGIRLIGCHSTTSVERNEIYSYQGTLTTETTIVRTSGASDGTTAYSWKVVTTADPKRTFPFETFEGVVWNTTTGSSKTLTVHTVTDNVTLTDAEAWLEVEYLGSSATPVATLITDANATVLTTAANQTTSTEVWTTTGLTTPIKQKLSVTFTPNMIGPVRWKVKVAKASTTVYVCPKAELS